MAILVMDNTSDMARIYSKTNSSAPTSSGDAAIVTPGYNNEGSALRFGYTVPLTYVLPAFANGDWIKLSFAYYRETLRDDNTSASLRIGMGDTSGSTATSNTDAVLYLDATNGDITLRTTSATTYTLLGTGAQLPPDQWVYIEYLHQYGTTGTAEVYLNGSFVGTSAGNNTGEPWVYCVFYPVTAAGSITTQNEPSISDIVIEHSTTKPAVHGPAKVRELTPTSDAAAAWAGSDGNSTDNYALVSDGSDATYITSTAGSAQVDRYGHAALTGNTVKGVSIDVKCAMDVAGTNAFSVIAERGGSTTAQQVFLGEGTPVWRSKVIENDPSTGAPWTKAGLNAATFGVRSS